MKGGGKDRTGNKQKNENKKISVEFKFVVERKAKGGGGKAPGVRETLLA